MVVEMEAQSALTSEHRMRLLRSHPSLSPWYPFVNPSLLQCMPPEAIAREVYEDVKWECLQVVDELRLVQELGEIQARLKESPRRVCWFIATVRVAGY